MRLEPGKLSWPLLFDLCPNIRDADLKECHKGSAWAAVIYGLHHGDLWLALDPKGRPLGVFGYTRGGSIWSLWRDMTVAESLAVLKHTPLWVASMVQASGLPFLANLVHTDNDAAIGWLLASGCFDFDWTPTHTAIPGQAAYYFRTKQELAQSV